MTTVDQYRQATARDRRQLIIGALNEHLALAPGTAASQFKAALSEPRTIVTDADIDGIASACMVASVSPWRIGVMSCKNGDVLVAPSFGSLHEALFGGHFPEPFGLDVYSNLFPNVSNHPVLFGDAVQNKATRDALVAFDEQVKSSLAYRGTINLSGWVGIAGTYKANRAQGMPYKYPLGTAQLLLAALEVVGLSPRFYDRQYLPWLIANCDGGLDSIRTYPWNVENWWSGLAAVAGPASQTEAIYRLAIEQRPTEFLDVDRRLRWDMPIESRMLSSKWNFVNDQLETIPAVVRLISDLSGWPDPFIGGAGSLDSWIRTHPTSNILYITGIGKLPANELAAHLTGASTAMHMNLSTFPEKGVYMAWHSSEALLNLELVIGDEAEDPAANATDDPELDLSEPV